MTHWPRPALLRADGSTCLAPQSRHAGFVLILVLVVISLISLSTYTVCSLIVTENQITIMPGPQLQPHSSVDSGVPHAL